MDTSADCDPKADDFARTTWWTGLSDRARTIWLRRVGSADAADAWTQFKANPGLAFEVGAQEARELSEGSGDAILPDQVIRKRARDLMAGDALVFRGGDGRLFTETVRHLRRTEIGSIIFQAGAAGHAMRACHPDDFVDVLRR